MRLPNLISVVRNDHGLYRGNLIPYFAIIWNSATNLDNPYHNFRHPMYATQLCYDACDYYSDELSQEKMRVLMIAEMFHDFDHTGKNVDDDINITKAILGIRKYILPEDAPSLSDIEYHIKMTQFPPSIPTEKLGLRVQIMRDADLCQVFEPDWMQQVVIGLAAEKGVTPTQMLSMQEEFLLERLRLHTEWAQERFPRGMIKRRVAEVREYLKWLEIKPATTA